MKINCGRNYVCAVVVVAKQSSNQGGENIKIIEMEKLNKNAALHHLCKHKSN